MYHERFAQHKFDQRLQTRRDWVSDADLKAHLDALPDVSDKIATKDAPVELAPSLAASKRVAVAPESEAAAPPETRVAPSVFEASDSPSSRRQPSHSSIAAKFSSR